MVGILVVFRFETYYSCTCCHTFKITVTVIIDVTWDDRTAAESII